MKKLLLLLAFVIFISGCTGNGTSSTKNGLVVNSFYADPQTVEEGEPVSLYLEIENKGDVTADFVTAQLYGVEGMWYVDPTATDAVQIADMLKCWEMTSVQFWWDSFSWSYFAGDLSCWNLLHQNNPLIKWGNLELEPPKPDIGKTHGDFAATEWRLYPPDLPEGVKQDFPLTAHIKYSYQTNAVINVKAVQEQEAKRMRQKGESVSNPITVSNTEGPIKISVVRADAPIIVENPYYRPLGVEFDPQLFNTFHTYNPYNPFFYTESTTYFTEHSYMFDPRALYFTVANNPYFNTFWGSRLSTDYYNDFIQKATFKIKLEDMGSGFPSFPTYRDAHGNVLEGAVFGAIRLESPIGPNGAPTAWFENCLGTPYGNVVIINDMNEELIRLKGDPQSEFGCTIGIDRVAWENKPIGNIVLIFDLYYVYDISETTTVTVKGRKEGRGMGGWIQGTVPTGPAPSEECTVTNANWGVASGEMGERVTMSADVQNCPYPINFKIMEHDATIFYKDDFVKAIKAQTDSRDQSGTGRVSDNWVIGAGTIGDIEDTYKFYFEVKAGNEKIGKSASKLSVGADEGAACSEIGKETCKSRSNCWWDQNAGACKACSEASSCSDFHYEDDCGKCGFNCKWDDWASTNNYCQSKGTGNCNIIDAYWESEITYLPSSELGSTISMLAEIENCEGMNVGFDIYEDRSWGDDKLASLNAEKDGNVYTKAWRIERNPNEPNDDVYKYHFDVMISGEDANDDDGDNQPILTIGEAGEACELEVYHWLDSNGETIGTDGTAKIGDTVEMAAKLSDGCSPGEVYFEIREQDSFKKDQQINRECFQGLCECTTSECDKDMGNNNYGFTASKEGDWWKASWYVMAEQQNPEEQYSYHFDVFADGSKLGSSYNIKVDDNCHGLAEGDCTDYYCSWHFDKSQCIQTSSI